MHPQTTPSAEQRTNKLKLIWGLICLIGPTALLIISILLYAVVNFVTTTVTPADSSDLFAGSSGGNTVLNIILFLVGAITVITWLPGIIVGIVLLATRKQLR